MNEDNIKLCCWKDQRDVHMLSTVPEHWDDSCDTERDRECQYKNLNLSLLITKLKKYSVLQESCIGTVDCYMCCKLFCSLVSTISTFA